MLIHPCVVGLTAGGPATQLTVLAKTSPPDSRSCRVAVHALQPPRPGPPSYLLGSLSKLSRPLYFPAPFPSTVRVSLEVCPPLYPTSLKVAVLRRSSFGAGIYIISSTANIYLYFSFILNRRLCSSVIRYHFNILRSFRNVNLEGCARFGRYGPHGFTIPVGRRVEDRLPSGCRVLLIRAGVLFIPRNRTGERREYGTPDPTGRTNTGGSSISLLQLVFAFSERPKTVLR